MNKEEIGRMEARLHSIVTNSRYNMTNKQKDDALEDMAGYLLDVNERVKAIELLAGVCIGII